MRRLRALLAVALLLVLAACTGGNGGNGSGSGAEGTGAASSPTASSSSASSAAKRAPWPGWPSYLPDPRHRVLLGGFVELPGISHAAAVAQRERAMGRPYDLQLTYYEWSDPFPDAGEAGMASRGTSPLMAWYGPDKQPGNGHTLAEVTSGADDWWITQQAEAIKNFGHRVFLRLMPEMNGPWYGYSRSPARFIAAWRHIHAVFARAGASNVSWVWCPNLGPADWDAYYPGNAYVDVVGVDAFSNTRYTWQTFGKMLGGFFAHMAEFTGHKPQMVVETATNSGNGDPSVDVGSAASYISGMASYLKTVGGPKYGVVAVCWFDAKDSGNDWRTNQTAAAWRAWLAMARDPFFGGRGP